MELKNLFTALAKAQSIMGGAQTDANNPGFNYDYATLASVWKAVRAPLTENGLSVFQLTKIVEGKMILVTTLAHASGEFITGEYIIDPVKKDPQGYGSAITYARRYTLMAIVGIAPEDDDGAGASTTAEKNQQPSKDYFYIPNFQHDGTKAGRFDGIDIGKVPLKELQEYVKELKDSAIERNVNIPHYVKEFIEAVQILQGDH